MKRLFLVGAMATVGAGVWFALRPARQAPPPPELTFLFTADVRGRLVPCGCFAGQHGGLTRIATMFGPPINSGEIRVDVGDALAGPMDYERLQYGYIQQAFARLGYDALNVGHREAALSAGELRTFKASAPVTMLSANLLDAATGAPLFDTHKIVRRGAARVALIGVMDARSVGDALGDGLTLEAPEVALGKLLPKIKGQADCIVLLAFSDEAALTALARQFYELDVILGGKVRQPSQQLVKENRSLILATTNESRAVGILHARLLATGRLEATKGEVVLVNEQIPQAEEIATFASEYRERIRTARLAIDDPAAAGENLVPGVAARATFAGTQSCAGCHPQAAQAWARSGHARAFSTLVAKRADADPTCIGCHTVGFGAVSGYRREFGAAKLVDVGCESCHGPGSQHVAERMTGAEVTTHFRPLGAGDCRKCHHGEFSRPFVWEEFWPHIAHGKEAAPPRAER